MSPELLLGSLVAAVVGACVGSFVATAVIRQASGEQALTGRSHCDGCQRPLAFHETVPLLSYVSATGSCRLCGTPIDRTHLAGELGGVLVALGAWLVPAPDLHGWALRGLCAGLGLALLAIGLASHKTRRAPGGVALAACALLAAAVMACAVRAGAQGVG